jgi:hypothetical protein
VLPLRVRRGGRELDLVLEPPVSGALSLDSRDRRYLPPPPPPHRGHPAVAATPRRPSAHRVRHDAVTARAEADDVNGLPAAGDVLVQQEQLLTRAPANGVDLDECPPADGARDNAAGRPEVSANVVAEKSTARISTSAGTSRSWYWTAAAGDTGAGTVLTGWLQAPAARAPRRAG